jgi:hypothetical protein
MLNSLHISQFLIPLNQSLIFEGLYSLKSVFKKPPPIHRFFQVSQVYHALDISSKVIQCFKPSFLLDSKIYYICLAAGMFSKVCFPDSRVDNCFNQIAQKAKIATIVASVSLIVFGDKATGIGVLSGLGMHYLEKKQITSLRFTNYFRLAKRTLNYAGFAAFVITAVMSGNVISIALASTFTAINVLNVIGPKYLPFIEKIPENAESELVKKLNCEEPPTINYDNYQFIFTQNFPENQPIPRFFTLQSPFQKVLTYKGFISENKKKRQEEAHEARNAIKNVLKQKSKRETTKALERLQKTLILKSEALYLYEKNNLLNSTFDNSFEDKIKDLKTLESERKKLIEIIQTNLSENELKDLQQYLKIAGFDVSYANQVESSVKELRGAYYEFTEKYNVNAQKNRFLFRNLSILGILQWEKREMLLNSSTSTYRCLPREMKSAFINQALKIENATKFQIHCLIDIMCILFTKMHLQDLAKFRTPYHLTDPINNFLKQYPLLFDSELEESALVNATKISLVKLEILGSSRRE